MRVIDVAGLIFTMTTNRMICRPRSAVVLRVNQPLDTQMTHVMHATHGAKMPRGFLGKFISLRLRSHCKSLFGHPLSVVSIASFAFRPEGRLCAGGPLQLSFLYDVEGTSVLGGAYNLSLLFDLKDVFVLEGLYNLSFFYDVEKALVLGGVYNPNLLFDLKDVFALEDLYNLSFFSRGTQNSSILAT